MHYRQATPFKPFTLGLSISTGGIVIHHQGTAIQPVALATPRPFLTSEYAPMIVSCCRQAHHTPCTASEATNPYSFCQNLCFPYLVCCCVSSLPVLLFTCFLDLTTPDSHLAITLATLHTRSTFGNNLC